MKCKCKNNEKHFVQISVEEGPFTKQVCELFDIAVLADIGCYYLGQKPEPAAGLYGYEVTRCFDSLALLEEFCKENIVTFLIWEKEHPDGAAPDATDWD